jgi:GntR family transcriptional regulator
MSKISFKPMYQQVYESLRSRMASGELAPGTFLPSENVLAEDYGVSQGTLRKAIDRLAADKLVVRYQGKGTAIALIDSDEALFRFFRLVHSDGHKLLPSSQVLGAESGQAGEDEGKALAIAAGDMVFRIHRLRMLDGSPAIDEKITVPCAAFPGIDELTTDHVPNTLYNYFQERYGTTVCRIREHLIAKGATAGTAKRLEVRAGHPVLQIRRVAYDLNDRPVEYRVMLCLTDHVHYDADLKR